MCKCITEIESKTFEAVQKQKEGEFTKGNITPSSFVIENNKFKARATHSEYEFTFAPKKKDGTIGKAKKQSVNIIHTYCPFCGEKY
jgi:hypothetical protein